MSSLRVLALTFAAFFFLGFAAVDAQIVNLTATAATTTLPDGQTVPMWGYQCTATTAAPATGANGATCAATNPNAGGGWSPVVITAATGSSLTINLTNSLPAPVPTSLVVVGQLGGGLGSGSVSVPSPNHATQTTTWSTANLPNQTFSPPAQPNRVQSFATEVLTAKTATLTWQNLKAGTYLIESGTHPSIQGPMGLYGVLVVTNAPSGTTAGTAYPGPNASTPGVSYSADVPLLLSEIDPVQNRAVQTAVTTAGFVETATHNMVQAGPVVEVSVTSGGSGYSATATAHRGC